MFQRGEVQCSEAHFFSSDSMRVHLELSKRVSAAYLLSMYVHMHVCVRVSHTDTRTHTHTHTFNARTHHSFE